MNVPKDNQPYFTIEQYKYLEVIFKNKKLNVDSNLVNNLLIREGVYNVLAKIKERLPK